MTAPSAPPSAALDSVLPYAVPSLDLRGRVVRLGPALDAILARHAYPTPVARLLAEAIALTSLLGTALKFEGRFVLQTRTDGPVSMLIVDFQTPDGLRAYASFDAEAVEAAIAQGSATPADLLGRGHLAMTIDQGGDMNRYQGVVALDHTGLEEVAHVWFQQSEQIPTKVRLAVAEELTRLPGGGTRHAWRAGGLLAQFLPESEDRRRARDLHPGDAPEGTDLPEVADDDAWTEAEALVATIEDLELTDPEVSAERLLFRLFHERGARVFEPQTLVERCRCSRERVEDMLGQFTAEQVEDMTVDGAIVVTCEFCSTKYTFDPATVRPPAA
ncbi:Hsp33 family molecular chaperone [Siculibacillus lacustris]|uniref:Hsp33 family molecular chaperone n=1 Tax=Siculibacillus lacustris TaxID=1549641 RepID=A0A4Q9VW45_9HYPH|nr:Hsp33 family molecular chaperone [Siculibacillus lacustris]TBW39293.1 Hsp33 family molecular chaperone [Siculibacillus lacustris]